MKKILLILSMVCLLPFIGQAQGTLKPLEVAGPLSASSTKAGDAMTLSGSECRPVTQFSATAVYDDVTLTWTPPTSNEIRYYDGMPDAETGALSQSSVWMAMRIPSTVLAEYPDTGEYPFSLTDVKFVPTISGGDITYRIEIYTADPEGPENGDFSVTPVGSYEVGTITNNDFNIVPVGLDIDKTQDLVIAVKATGTGLQTLSYTTTGAVMGWSNIISLDGVNFNYEYENTASQPISWYIAAIVDYQNNDGQKNIVDNVAPVTNMIPFNAAKVYANNTKLIPEVETVQNYIISRDGAEIATVAGDVLSYVDVNLPHVTATYEYSIVAQHNNDGEICNSRPVTDNVSLSFCTGADHMVQNLTSFVNIEERAISVYWQDPVQPGFVDFTVLCYNLDLGICIKVANTNIYEYTLSGLPAGNYEFCVVANYPTCVSDEVCSGVLNLPVECGYPVTGLTAQQGTVEVKLVELDWTAPTTSHEIANYTVNKYELVGGSFVQINQYTTTGVEYNDVDIEFGTTYKYGIVANYTNGCYSAPVDVEVTPVLTPVSNLQYTVVNDLVTLTWDAPTQPGLTGYMVYDNGTAVAFVTETTYSHIFPVGNHTFTVTAQYSNQYESDGVDVDVLVTGGEVYTINAVADPIEAGSVAGTGTYHYGETVNLIATAYEGYMFMYWAEASNLAVPIATTAEYSFMATENRNLVARFGRHNVLSVVDAVARTNDTVTITLNLANVDPAVGVQADINLGQLEYVASSAVLTERATSYHSLAASIVDDTVLRVLVYSFPATAFNGNDGGVLTFDVVTGSNEGTFPITLSNAMIVDELGTTLNLGLENGQVLVDDIHITASANPAEGGVVTGAGVYSYGDIVTLTATANTHYYFVNWTDGDGNILSTEPIFVITANEDRTLIANFVPAGAEIVITTTAVPAAGGVLTGAGTYYAGDDVVITATANEGYEFVNWMENGSVLTTSEVYTFTASENRNFVANFVETSPTIAVTLTADPVEGGIVIGTGNYAIGTTVNVTAIANEGYVFVNWTEDGSVVTSEYLYTFTATVDRNLVAHFATSSGVFPPVENLTLVDKDNLTANISWTPAEGSTPVSYTINSYSSLGVLTGSYNVYETSSLVKFFAEDTYRVGVIANYATGRSTENSIAVDIAVNRILNFRVANTQLNQIDLSWDPCPSDRYDDFYKYEITRPGNTIAIYDVNDTTAVDFLADAGAYEYCITIYYGQNGIVATEPICHVLTTDFSSMFPPVTLHDPLPVNLSVYLAWEVQFPEAVEYYKVYMDGEFVDITTEQTYICKLKSEQLHTASVVAVYGMNESHPSSKDFVNDVNEVTPVSVSQFLNKVTLSWGAPVDTYSDYYYYTIKRNGTTIANLYDYNETSYMDAIEEGYTSYEYCVIVNYVNHTTSGDIVVAAQPVCKNISIAEIFPSIPFINVDNMNLSYVATWEPMEGADSYTVSVDGVFKANTKIPTFSERSASIGNKTISVVVVYDEGVSAETAYQFQLSLNPPRYFDAVAEGNHVNLSWTEPIDKYNDLTGYVILRNSVQIISLGLDDKSYVDYPGAGTYEYCVKAQYGYDMYSAGSCESGLMTLCDGVEDILVSFDYATGEVVVTWNAPAEGDYVYNVYKNGTKVASVTQPRYVDTDVHDYEDVTYAVSVSCSAEVESGLSNPFTGSFACGTMPVKNLRAVYDPSTISVTISWDKPLSFINGQLYNVYRQGELIAANYADNVYVDYTQLPSGTYTYTVMEVCKDGSESPANNVTCAVETGIEDYESLNVQVYPNPTAGDVTVKCDDMAKVVVYNSLGQVMSTINAADGVNEVTVNTSSMQSGVYILRITTNNGQSLQRRVVVAK